MWQQEASDDGQTLEELLKKSVMETLTELHLLCAHASEYGVELTDEEQQEIAGSAQKDKEKVKQHPAMKAKVEQLLGILRENPWQNPPPYEKLKGDLAGMYSRRINVQHRLVYQVFEKEKTVRILAMWTHYEN